MVGRHHAITLYIKRFMIYDMIYDIYPRLMTKVNVSPTVGMSATVEEMSATVGKLNML